MARVSLDRFKTGADNSNDLMITMSYEVGQRGADVFLIVGNQDAHMFFAEVFVPPQQTDNRSSLRRCFGRRR
jgi:hypothetical protein